jgi:hypothetical protein
VAHSGKRYAKVRADHALMTTLWAAGRKMNLKVAMLFGLTMFASLFTFFTPTDNNPSCLVEIPLWGRIASIVIFIAMIVISSHTLVYGAPGAIDVGP